MVQEESHRTPEEKRRPDFAFQMAVESLENEANGLTSIIFLAKST
jgi:hypothetical protein